MEKQTYKITGMSCANCARATQKKLKKIEGVSMVQVDFLTEKCLIEFDEKKTGMNEIENVIHERGYVLELI